MADPTFQSVALGFTAAAKGLQALKELVRGAKAREQITALYDVINTAQGGPRFLRSLFRRTYRSQVAHSATVIEMVSQ